MTVSVRLASERVHLSIAQRRLLDFEITHPGSGAEKEDLVAMLLGLTPGEYAAQLGEVLTTPCTSPEEAGLIGLVLSRVDAELERETSTVKFVRVHGRTFMVSAEMAAIFLAHANRALLTGDGSLVLLRHVDGIEMIPILRSTPFEVTDV